MERFSSVKSKISSKALRYMNSVWEAVTIGVTSLYSFVSLYFRQKNHVGIRYVTATAAIAYIMILLAQAIALRTSPQKLPAVHLTKKVFRLIYTAIYLTSIMLDILRVADTPKPEYALSYYGFLFIWVALWGTNCLWLKKLVNTIKDIRKR